MNKALAFLPIYLFRVPSENSAIEFNDLPMIDRMTGEARLPGRWNETASGYELWHTRNFILGKMWVWAYLRWLWQGGPLEDRRFRIDLGPLTEIVGAWIESGSGPLMDHPFALGVFEEIDYYLSCALSGDAARREMAGWIMCLRSERWNQCAYELHAATTKTEQDAAITSFMADTRKEPEPV